MNRCVRGVATTLVVVGLLAGCTRTYPGGGTTLCGKHINTGAMSVGFDPLDPALPAPPGPVPTTSSLPPPTTISTVGEWYLRTSPTCAVGAVVVVSPTDAARLWVTVPADDGGITGIALARVSAPVTVSAWVAGRYQGSRRLFPPAAPSDGATPRVP